MMKKKLFFTFACAMALIAGFVSCTNDDFEELAPVAEMQKSAMTRSASGMTKEEVQARLDELSEKYGINVNMLYVRDYSEFTESTFEKIEQDIIAYKNRDINANAVTAQAGGNNLMDDCVIDEYEIATLSTNAEPSAGSGFVLQCNVRYKVPYIYSEDSLVVLDTQIDCYSYEYNVNIRHFAMSDDVVIESYIRDLSEAVNEFGQEPKSTCEAKPLRYSSLSCNGPGMYSFDFEFDIYASYVRYDYFPYTVVQTPGRVQGSYNNGLQHLLVMASGSEMVLDCKIK